MFNPTQVVIEAFVQELQAMYLRNYGVLEPNYPGFIAFIGRGAYGDHRQQRRALP